MSLRAPRCGKHPSHPLVGVCAFCLRERLIGLADVECALDASIPHTHSKKKKSPAHAFSTQAVLHSKPSGRRGIDQSTGVSVSTQVLSAANNVSDERLGPAHAHARSYAFATSSDKPVIASSVTHAHRNVPSCAKKTLVETISSPRASPKPSKLRCSDAVNGAGGEKLLRGSMEIPAGRHSFLSAKRLPSGHMESKLPPVDIKKPILENSQHAPLETRSIKQGLKKTSIDCTSPLVGVDWQASATPAENRAYSVDNQRSSSNGLLGSRPPLETRADMDVSAKDAEIILPDESANHGHVKKTLSSLFSLDDAEFSAGNALGEAMFTGSFSAPAPNVSQAGMSQRKCKHGSFSEREPSTYLFPVPEMDDSKPLSWFSSLFRRRKKKPHPKSGEALASFSEHNIGWEDARQSWEAPRPSSWEQYRFSSFEGPRSSWEPACPSWEGVMRTSDGDSVFSGFDFFTESSIEAKEDVGLERKHLHEFAGDLANGSDARRSLDSRRAALRPKPLGQKIPNLDDKDRARTFLSAKAMLMQKDVSTQTTPPRSSDTTEMFLQQRLQPDHHCRRQHAKGSHAVWSKVWTKTFSNSKWAFKQRQHKERRHKERGDVVVASDEIHEQGNTTSGRSSFHEGTHIESSHHLKLAHSDKVKEHEAWDAFCSPLQQGKDSGNGVSRLVSIGEACPKKEEHADSVRGSNFSLDNGLLKFYLTPVRGHGMRGKTKPAICGL